MPTLTKVRVVDWIRHCRAQARVDFVTLFQVQQSSSCSPHVATSNSFSACLDEQILHGGGKK